ncbi:MAG TPA: hypothetical protein PK881_10080, partial [Leptospiraceae bacterium]|nr:hypothetical protein [Leptospiraceae bacterium]
MKAFFWTFCRERFFHCVAEFDEHGRVAGALSMMTDISQLKKAQADAERYASEMRAITAAFPDLYFKMNIEGRFLEAIGGHSVFGDTSRLRGRHYSEI